MSFDVHPDDTAPLAVPAGGSRSVALRARSGAENSMWIRLVALPQGSAPPEISLRVDGGAPVVVPELPNTAPVLDGSGVKVGDTFARTEPGGVFLLRTVLENAVSPAQSWTIGIRNTGAQPREFVWVVADNREETAQPWMSLPAEVYLSAITDRPTPTATLQVRNLGTGPLRLTGPGGDLGGGVAVALPGSGIAPNGTANATVTFTAPTEPGTVTVVHTFTGDDPRAGTSGPHNARTLFVATVRAPLWLPGELLVADPTATDGSVDITGGLVRIRPLTAFRPGEPEAVAPFVAEVGGRQELVSGGGKFASPGGVALDPDGNALVADPSAGDGTGAVIRVDRITGVQTVVSSGGMFSDPISLVVRSTGLERRIVVADTTAFGGNGGLIAVDEQTGQQSAYASGLPLRQPIAVADAGGGSLVVLNSVAAPNTKGVRLVRVDFKAGLTALADPVPGERIHGLAVDGAGRILVIRRGIKVGEPTALIAVAETDLGTVVTVVSSGMFLGESVGLGIDGAGRVLATDWKVQGRDRSGVVRVDPAGGPQVLHSIGGLLGNPRSIVVVPGS